MVYLYQIQFCHSCAANRISVTTLELCYTVLDFKKFPVTRIIRHSFGIKKFPKHSPIKSNLSILFTHSPVRGVGVTAIIHSSFNFIFMTWRMKFYKLFSGSIFFGKFSGFILSFTYLTNLLFDLRK